MRRFVRRLVRRFPLSLALALLVALLMSSGGVSTGAHAIARADTGAVYELSQDSISVAASASGGAYDVSYTIGQADVGESSGGDYTLGDGFWGGGAVSSAGGRAIFLPVMTR